MSPEHSATETEEPHSSDSDSDDEGERQTKKVIRVRPLSWRSDRFKNIIESLDRKYLRRASEKARSLMKDRLLGEPMVTEAPEQLPQWMVKGN